MCATFGLFLKGLNYVSQYKATCTGLKKNTISKDNMNIEILPFNLSLDLSSDLKTASGCFPAYSTNLDPYVWLSKAF